jgi:hypothetical protein
MRNTVGLIIISVFLLFNSPVNAFDEIEFDYLTEMSEHQCQSRDSIGHSCKNLGVNFTDCNQAFFKLKRDDCCSGSEYGGNSIGFKLTKCTNFN